MDIKKQIAQSLLKRNETLSVAESCTGGGLSNAITEPAGISGFYLGSVTTYSNTAKKNILKVSCDALHTHGAVSEIVAKEMAMGCKKLFKSTWSLSTTGIAGPTGGTRDKPTGTVYIGLSGPNICFAQKFLFKNCSRIEHRYFTIEEALLMLFKQL